MINFLLLLLVPLFIGTLVMFVYNGKVTRLEFLTQIGIVAAFIAICMALSYCDRTADVEIWNSQVVSRTRDKVSCEHSYPCNCRPVSCGKNCTSIQCDTCYEHPYDVDWNVHSSTNEVATIDRIDSQGLRMPPRWGAVFLGEPFSSKHQYTNYILANPDTVLLGTRGDDKKFAKWIPKYNSTIYDYYKHDPVVNMGVPNVDIGTWNWLFREVNKQLGPLKQVNINVILVPTDDRSYVLALKDAWVGGKKNDATIVIGSLDGHEIKWADILSWSPSGQYKTDIKDGIEDIGTLDRRDDIQQLVLKVTKNEFVRMHMKDLKYLVRSFQPSLTAMWIIFVLATLLEIGLAYRSVTNQITDARPRWEDDEGNIKV